MARARRKKGNVELAAELRAWAATHQISDDIYLSELADALEIGDQLDYWSRYENLDLLPTPVDKNHRSPPAAPVQIVTK